MVRILRATVFLALVGMLCSTATVGAASQQGKPQKPQARQPEITGRMGAPELMLQGPVLSVNPGAGFLLIRHGAGKDATEEPVEIDSKTTLTRGGQRVNIDAVKPGDTVRIHYSGRAGEVMKVVEIAAGKGMPAPKKPAAKHPAMKQPTKKMG